MKSLITLIACLVSVNSLALESQYTSVDPKDCITVDASNLHPDPEIDYYEGHCPSFGGYSVIIDGGDLRYDLSLAYNGKRLPKFIQSGPFHDMGSKKIEWRYSREKISRFNYKIVYKALIFRINSSSMDTHGNPVNTSDLYVVKLDGEKSCVVAVVPQSTTMNQDAQKISDVIDQKACLP